MARKCEISGAARQVGHRVSHANNKRKHVFMTNLQTKRLWIAEQNRYLTIRVSTRILRTIDKLGLTATLNKYGLKLEDLRA